MTLKHKIFHVRVGAKKPFEEIEGFLKNDLSTLKFNKCIPKSDGLNPYIRENIFNELNAKIIEIYLKQNPNHPISEFATKLGAIPFGGFEDEKDFYLALPCIDGLKVGDYFHKEYQEPWELDEHIAHTHVLIKFTNRWYGDTYKFIHYKETGRIWYHTQSTDGDTGIGEGPDNFEYSFTDFLKEHYQGNLFEEYAKTGKIDNELYNKFFK